MLYACCAWNFGCGLNDFVGGLVVVADWLLGLFASVVCVFFWIGVFVDLALVLLILLRWVVCLVCLCDG